MYKIFLILFLILFTFLPSAEGMNLSDDNNLSNQCNWHIKHVRILAEKGNSEYQLKYARMFENGFDCIKQSDTLAYQWRKHAVEQKHPPAFFELSKHYLHGKGVEKNIPRYLELLQLGADLDDSTAQTFLGLNYQKGKRLTKNCKKAVHWLTLASEQHDPDAQYYLGDLYRKGCGDYYDPRKALYWYTKLGFDASLLSNFEAGKMYFRGNLIEPDYYKARELLGQIVWLKPYAGYAMGIMLKSGMGGYKSINEAYRYFKISADKGFSASQYNLALFYREGKGVMQNYSEMVRYLSMASKQGDAMAQFDLAVSYNLGKGVLIDQETAYMWLIIAQANATNDFLREPISASIKQLSPTLSESQLKAATSRAKRCMSSEYQEC